MADTATAHEPRDLAPDLVGVKSRVSWSAIFGGAIIALACCFVLTLLLGAVGISLTEAGVRTNAVSIGVLIAVILTIIVSLFLGGWIASQLTVGENRQEAVIYGLLTWAVATAIFMGLAGMSAKAGYFAVVGGSMMAQNNPNAPRWEDGLKAAGMSDARIAEIRAGLDPERLRAAANDPAEQERAREGAMAAAWIALVATMLGMAASVCGAVVGRGTSFRLYPVARVRTAEGPKLIIPTA